MENKYLIRSKLDGKYLVARVTLPEEETEQNYLLIFQENFEALSYLNTHAPQMSSRFTVESIANAQLKSLLQRWGYKGIGLVEDPLLPQINFMSYGDDF